MRYSSCLSNKAAVSTSTPQSPSHRRLAFLLDQGFEGGDFAAQAVLSHRQAQQVADVQQPNNGVSPKQVSHFRLLSSFIRTNANETTETQRGERKKAGVEISPNFLILTPGF